jgi:uncharacterized membrane protein YgdD (TMEM256/DUF423 family)
VLLAHALKKVLLPEQLITLKPGTLSNVPCFVLILIALLNDLKNKESYLLFSRFCVILFLSIYLLATNNLTSFDFKVIGFVTPIGGLLLIVVGAYYFSTFEEKTTK